MSSATKATKWWIVLLSGASAMGWLLLLAYWGAITFNRNTDNSLGLYVLFGSQRGGDPIFWICLFGVPMLTVVMFIRMALRHRSAFFELPLAIVVWSLFLYNLSFIRS
ncbi:hypothetical protein [Stenotrophomonas maltophilia]|uniref:hypothetical protein n=1 Tax=Stenotrophomonas maltophilia TaxID=40324 RepID=UPI0013D9EE86|nr:hypothetical protein [Stenotrophomonas maltophilia]